MIEPTTDADLIALARQARERAYAPYSRFAVGAALLSRSGRVFTGCNVENAAYPLCTCAERAAVVKAVSEGEREFVAIAVVTASGATPCGACRQILREFGGLEGDLRVIAADLEGRSRTFTIAELLPAGFTAAQLPRRG
ncbi:MAG TPA: cytidine deaminase [Anaerolineae bacterium]|nr:cytidine deaminase [Anaerolineae bacterium]